MLLLEQLDLVAARERPGRRLVGVQNLRQTTQQSARLRGSETVTNGFCQHRSGATRTGPALKASLSNRVAAGSGRYRRSLEGVAQMSNRPSRPQGARDPEAPKMELLSSDENLVEFEALVLEVTGSMIPCVETAEEDCERKLALIFSEAGFRTLLVEQAAPRLRLL